MHTDIVSYNASQQPDEQAICELLAGIIDRYLPTSESKVWHAHPVWFIEGNPIVGYAKRKDGINLLFWSGQSFEESSLKSEGKFKAAEICYAALKQVNKSDLKRWLKKAAAIQWDYKNIVKKKGVLDRLDQ